MHLSIFPVHTVEQFGILSSLLSTWIVALYRTLVRHGPDFKMEHVTHAKATCAQWWESTLINSRWMHVDHSICKPVIGHHSVVRQLFWWRKIFVYCLHLCLPFKCLVKVESFFKTLPVRLFMILFSIDVTRIHKNNQYFCFLDDKITLSS
jgi:hypothetical protein